MKVIEKLEKLGDEFKEAITTTAWLIEYATDFYNDLLGYPYGGLTLWVIVSAEIIALSTLLGGFCGI